MDDRSIHYTNIQTFHFGTQSDFSGFSFSSEKTASCEQLLKEIAEGTTKAQAKKTAAKTKAKDIDSQTKEIAIEKVGPATLCWQAVKPDHCVRYIGRLLQIFPVSVSGGP